MPPFASNPLKPHHIHERLRKHPLLFGIPFVLIMVGASFGLQSFTQTRYELQDKKIRTVRITRYAHPFGTYWWIVQVTKEQELGLSKSKKKFDIREEYYVR